MFRGNGHQNGCLWNLEPGIQLFAVVMWLDNPTTTLEDLLFLTKFLQQVEHVEVPLSKFVDPAWQQVHAVRVLDHVVKSALIFRKMRIRTKRNKRNRRTIRRPCPFKTKVTRARLDKPSMRYMKKSIAKMAGRMNSKRSTVGQDERSGSSGSSGER